LASGGRGIAGGFVPGTIENFAIWKLPVEWKSAIAFAVLIIGVVIRPKRIVKK